MLKVFAIGAFTVVFVACSDKETEEESEKIDTREELEGKLTDGAIEYGKLDEDFEIPDWRKFRRYYIEKGHVKLELVCTNIPEIGGEMEIYFDTYGMREYRLTTMSRLGEEALKKVDILDGEYHYSMDHTTNKFVKMHSVLNFMTMGMTSNDLAAEGMKVYEEMGGKKVGTEDILGVTCEKWEGPLNTWVYEGVLIKGDVKMGGLEMIFEPVEVDFESPIDAKWFEVPADIVFEEMDFKELGIKKFDVKKMFENMQDLDFTKSIK
jgi:hypothetical protein